MKKSVRDIVKIAELVHIFKIDLEFKTPTPHNSHDYSSLNS